MKSTTTKGISVKKLNHAQLNINVITLKLYSLFYSLVMNDFDRVILRSKLVCIRRTVCEGFNIK